MQWVAKKTMIVQDAQGVKRTVSQGEVVPEAKSWRNPSLWCLAVPDSQVASAPASAPAGKTAEAPAAGGASTVGGDAPGSTGSADKEAPANPDQGAAGAALAGDSAKPAMIIPSIDTLNKTDLMAHMTEIGVQFKATDDKATLWVKYQEFIAEQNKGEV